MLALTGHREAVHPDDVGGLERWVAAQQAHLRLLQRQLHAAREALADIDGPVAGAQPHRSALEEQLADAIDARARHLAVQLEAAQAEAAARVAQATHEATLLLNRAAADAEVIRRIVTPTDAQEPSHAGDDDEDEDDLGHWPEEDADLGARSERAPDAWIDLPSVVEGPPWAPGAGGLVAGRPPFGHGDRFDAPLGIATAVPGSASAHLDARAFEQFWGGALGEAPVRERLRRWVQRVEQ